MLKVRPFDDLRVYQGRLRYRDVKHDASMMVTAAFSMG